DQVYLVGEQCLQNYLKQNNGKCPIQQHQHCEFSQGKTVRKSVSELLVICPRQFDLKKGQSNKGVKFREDEENCESNSNSKNNCNCNFKGKMKDLKDHLDNSCNLIPIEQNIPHKITDQLSVMNGQIKILQNVVKDLQLQLNEKDKQIEQINKQMNDLKVETLKKDQTITALTNNIQQYKTQFDEFKTKFETK
ncbi:hypothetical protein RFI_34793, partial [Reticulomyxa filosa]